MDDKAARDAYVSELFAQEDEVLAWIQAETRRHNMPQISLSAQEGRLLQWLAQVVNARRIVEIGTLAGYSGTWLARALPEGGMLYTLEVSSLHARVARASFARGGLTGRVQLLEGPALESLKEVSAHAPFDLIFIDADKEGYPQYLAWALEYLRVGGVIASHNAFRGGRVLAPESADDGGMDQFNRALAAEPRLSSTLFAIGDGMAVGIKLR